MAANATSMASSRKGSARARVSGAGAGVGLFRPRSHRDLSGFPCSAFEALLPRSALDVGLPPPVFDAGFPRSDPDFGAGFRHFYHGLGGTSAQRGADHETLPFSTALWCSPLTPGGADNARDLARDLDPGGLCDK
ncbi:hypothetical protein [Streptomyces sp. LN245]|uniref:hypothetical protein n=1 Tax=Streptomyces sp. LN245 TaxID=3112975 RepID=UPI003712F306